MSSDRFIDNVVELATLRLKEHGFIIEPRPESGKTVQYISKDVVEAVLWAEFQERYIPGVLAAYRAKLSVAKQSITIDTEAKHLDDLVVEIGGVSLLSTEDERIIIESMKNDEQAHKEDSQNS